MVIACHVTQRRKREAQLARGESPYRLLAERSTDVISRHDPAGPCRYASPASRRVLGRPLPAPEATATSLPDARPESPALWRR